MLVALGVAAALALTARLIYPRFIERRERSRFVLGPDGIIPGAAMITQARANATGVLLLHGGGDTPQVLSDLAEYLYRRGFSVVVPLLAGHGRGLMELATMNSAAIFADAKRHFDAMRATHHSVAVVGLSMGGALATELVSERDDVAALVLLAPYVAMPVALGRMAALSASWGWLLPYFSSRGEQSIHDRVAAGRALSRGVLTPAALRTLYDFVLRATTALPRVRAPTLFIQSREDNRISRANAERAFALLGAQEKRLEWVEGAGHVITVDFGRERVFELTAAWLEAHTRRAAAT